MAKFPSEEQDRFIVRMPTGMRDRLRDQAEANKRSMNAEIVARLEDSFLPESNADLRAKIETLLRYVASLERLKAALEASTDSSRSLSDFYEKQIADLEGKLDRIAAVSMFVANAVQDSVEQTGSDLMAIADLMHPFADDKN